MLLHIRAILSKRAILLVDNKHWGALGRPGNHLSRSPFVKHLDFFFNNNMSQGFFILNK
jgi:hypothetical protein